MKKVLLGMFLLSPAMLWAQDEESVLASVEPEMKISDIVMVTPPPARPIVAPPALIAVKGKPGTNAGAYVSFVEGRADCQRGMIAIAIKNGSDKPVVALVEKSMYYSYHNMTSKDVKIDNLGAGEVRTLGCKGSVESETGDTHSIFKLKAAAFK